MVPCPKMAPKTSTLSIVRNLVTRMRSSQEVGTSQGEPIMQTGEEAAKSKGLPVMGGIGLNNPTGNGADLLQVLYSKERRQIYECTTFNDATEREVYRQSSCPTVERH